LILSRGREAEESSETTIGERQEPEDYLCEFVDEREGKVEGSSVEREGGCDEVVEDEESSLKTQPGKVSIPGGGLRRGGEGRTRVLEASIQQRMAILIESKGRT
jgi:hypothetical protein